MLDPINSGISKLRKYFELHTPLSDEEWEILESKIKPTRILKGKNFIKAGEISNKIGFIVEGCMRYYYLKNGEEITGEFWREYEIVGSFESIFLNQPSTQTIESLENVEMLTLEYKDLQDLFLKYHHLETNGRMILEKLLAESQQRIASYIMDSPEERYLRLIDEMPGIINRVPQKYIASFIGVTAVSLSRIRRRIFEKKGE